MTVTPEQAKDLPTTGLTNPNRQERAIYDPYEAGQLLARAEAEVEKLREALRDIETQVNAKKMRAVARAALEDR